MAAQLDFDAFIRAPADTKRQMAIAYIESRREAIQARQDEQVTCDICFSDVDISFFYKVPACGHQFCIPVRALPLTRSVSSSTRRSRSRARRARSAAPTAGARRRSRSRTSPRAA